MTKPTNERLARVEEQIIGLKADIAEVKADTKDIKNLLMTNYVPVKNFEEHLKQCKSNNVWKWTQGIIGGVITALLIFLIIEFFETH